MTEQEYGNTQYQYDYEQEFEHFVVDLEERLSTYEKNLERRKAVRAILSYTAVLWRRGRRPSGECLRSRK